MSDFVSPFWSLFIAAATVLSLAACLVLLAVAARRRVVIGPDGQPEETTGHVWDDDLRELNNPLPRWWMVLFVLTVVFSVGYLALFPGLGSAKGSLGWSSSGEVAIDRALAQAAAAPLYERLAALPAEALAADPVAMGLGERLFINNCATCHGSDARGSKGFPNLTDNDWLHGGTPEQIEQTIAAGRQGVMPVMSAAVGSATDVRNLSHYVLSLSGGPHNPLWAQLGRPKFGVCSACHGAGGKGNAALGAPSLADDIWLHGWGEAAVTAMVTQGKTNVMPAHAGRLSTEQIHVLTAYVWQLSHPAPRAQ